MDEDGGAEPTGVREHANVPMEKVVRDRSDHLFPTFNTHIPDAPLPENPDRFNRFGRFKQVFERRLRRPRARRLQAAELRRPLLPERPRRRRQRHQPGRARPGTFTRFVQDNDAALGLTVELISKSPCWKDTVIFVVEDDTQNGARPRRRLPFDLPGDQPVGEAGERHARPTRAWRAIFKTVDLILGMPPLNQYDAAATDSARHVHGATRLPPYDFVQPAYVAKAKKSWKRLTRGIDFSAPDATRSAAPGHPGSEGLPRRAQVMHPSGPPPRVARRSRAARSSADGPSP